MKNEKKKYIYIGEKSLKLISKLSLMRLIIRELILFFISFLNMLINGEKKNFNTAQNLQIRFEKKKKLSFTNSKNGKQNH